MVPELIDAIAISTLGNFKSKAGKFVGSVMFGYKKRDGYSVTNLGNVDNDNILEAMFIPPASPANRKTMGVVSVNKYMKKCTALDKSNRNILGKAVQKKCDSFRISSGDKETL